MSHYRHALVAAGDGVLAQAGIEAAEVCICEQAFATCPETVRVPVGAWVRWVNLDERSHAVVGLSGLFRSAALAPAQSCAFRFLRRGTYHYVCTIQPRMVGAIVVD